MRTLTRTAVGVAPTAALMPFVSLVTNAQNSGGWARSRTSPPTWVFSHHPWLRTVGLASTAAAVILLIRAAVLYNRRRRQTSTSEALSTPQRHATPPKSS